MISKKDLRAKGRAAVPSDRESYHRHCAAIREAVSRTTEFWQAPRVALFCGRDWEPDLRELWTLRPAHCVFPRSQPADRSLSFYRVDRLEDLTAGYAGILEPPVVHDRRVGDWTRDDLILVPGLYFDRQGARIGSGHGYYDRFLAQVPSLRWGVAFAGQVTNETLAQEPTDVRMGSFGMGAGIP